MKGRSLKSYFYDIINSIDEIRDFIKGLTHDDFIKDKKTINAVVRSIEVIGEAVKKIPKATREKYSSVPWKRITGMRDKLIHEYFGVDLEILWDTVNHDVPPLKPLLKKMLKDLEK